MSFIRKRNAEMTVCVVCVVHGGNLRPERSHRGTQNDACYLTRRPHPPSRGLYVDDLQKRRAQFIVLVHITDKSTNANANLRMTAEPPPESIGDCGIASRRTVVAMVDASVTEALPTVVALVLDCDDHRTVVVISSLFDAEVVVAVVIVANGLPVVIVVEPVEDVGSIATLVVVAAVVEYESATCVPLANVATVPLESVAIAVAELAVSLAQIPGTDRHRPVCSTQNWFCTMQAAR